MRQIMRGLEIHDGVATTGGLNFDLAEILACLGESLRSSTWRCLNLNYTSRNEQDIPVFHDPPDEARRVTHVEFLRATDQLLQVIDGDFEAIRPGEDAPWLRIRAIDSSWWEVYSTDEAALRAVRARFADVREIDEVPQN